MEKARPLCDEVAMPLASEPATYTWEPQTYEGLQPYTIAPSDPTPPQELPSAFRQPNPYATGERPIGTIHANSIVWQTDAPVAPVQAPAETVAAPVTPGRHAMPGWRESWRQNWRTIRATVGATALAVGLASGAAVVHHADAEQLNPATARAMADIDNRLQLPDVPAIPRNASKKEIKMAAATMAGHEHLAFERRKQIAERDHVTVYDPTSTIRALSQPHLKPASEIAIASKFMSKYGSPISVESPDKAKEYTLNMQPATPKDLATPNLQNYLINLVRERAQLPVEYTEDLGVNRILVAADKPGQSLVAAAYSSLDKKDEQHDSIVINISSGYSDALLGHEYTHYRQAQLESAHTGGNLKDEFAQQAGNAPFATDSSGAPVGPAQGYHTYDEYKKLRAKELKALSSVASKPDCNQRAEAANERLAAYGAETAYTDDYGATAQNEEYAQIGGLIATGENGKHAYADIRNGNLPLIKGQVLYELGRLENDSPALHNAVTFLIDAADKTNPQQTNDMHDACKPKP